MTQRIPHHDELRSPEWPMCRSRAGPPSRAAGSDSGRRAVATEPDCSRVLLLATKGRPPRPQLRAASAAHRVTDRWPGPGPGRARRPPGLERTVVARRPGPAGPP